MRTSDIRPSLHYQTYINHSKSLKFAADENLQSYIGLQKGILDSDGELKALGLFSSSLLLYAISIELILKARGLYFEIEYIKNGEIKNFKDFMKRWNTCKSNGHDLKKLIEHYSIHLTDFEEELIFQLQPFTQWDGRFPFPRHEEEIKKLEDASEFPGKLKEKLNEEIENFIDKQIQEMSK